MDRDKAVRIVEELIKGNGVSLQPITLTPGTEQFNALYDVCRLVDEKVDQRNLLTGREWQFLLTTLRDRYVGVDVELIYDERILTLLNKIAEGLGYFCIEDMPDVVTEA